MNAIETNEWSRGFAALGKELPRPKAVLAVSAHWYLEGTFATADQRPRTIHDFGGFPQALYRIEYPAPGDPDLARRVVALIGAHRASSSTAWGIDHGTWTVLVHLLPAADCPVVQVSIDERLSGAEHLATGRALAPLRDEGVLIMGSGNMVHNLGHAFSAWRRGDLRTPEWAAEFDHGAAAALQNHDTDHLIQALSSPTGRMAHPTPEHYVPLLYTAGAGSAGEPVRFANVGFDMGSLSMRAVIIG